MTKPSATIMAAEMLIKNNPLVEKEIHKCSNKWHKQTKHFPELWPREGTFDPKKMSRNRDTSIEKRKKQVKTSSRK